MKPQLSNSSFFFSCHSRNIPNILSRCWWTSYADRVGCLDNQGFPDHYHPCRNLIGDCSNTTHIPISWKELLIGMGGLVGRIWLLTWRLNPSLQVRPPWTRPKTFSDGNQPCNLPFFTTQEKSNKAGFHLTKQETVYNSWKSRILSYKKKKKKSWTTNPASKGA